MLLNDYITVYDYSAWKSMAVVVLTNLSDCLAKIIILAIYKRQYNIGSFAQRRIGGPSVTNKQLAKYRNILKDKTIYPQNELKIACVQCRSILHVCFCTHNSYIFNISFRVKVHIQQCIFVIPMMQ